jgi:hypothetical protein
MPRGSPCIAPQVTQGIVAFEVLAAAKASFLIASNYLAWERRMLPNSQAFRHSGGNIFGGIRIVVVNSSAGNSP